MRKSQKFMMIALLLAVIAFSTVAPSLSWLSSTTAPVINTFSGGAISIILDEALVGTDGKAIVGEGSKRVTANSYKYMAGAVYDKDPTPTVLKGSEECYVFLCVENQLNDKFTLNYNTSSWLEVAHEGNTTVYAYKTKVNALEAGNDIALDPIFTTITVSNDLTADDITKLGEKTLSVTAYAVQTNSLTSDNAIDLAVEQFLPNSQASHYPSIN